MVSEVAKICSERSGARAPFQDGAPASADNEVVREDIAVRVSRRAISNAVVDERIVDSPVVGPHGSYGREHLAGVDEDVVVNVVPTPANTDARLEIVAEQRVELGLDSLFVGYWMRSPRGATGRITAMGANS